MPTDQQKVAHWIKWVSDPKGQEFLTFEDFYVLMASFPWRSPRRVYQDYLRANDVPSEVIRHLSSS